MNRDLKNIFVAPPISVLDIKQKYWKDRKKEWLALGIQSELGRNENLLSMSELMQTKHNATSVFDPVLTECMYHWFTKDNDVIFDPFAGGSVRGIVAAKMMRQYTGLELRPDQIASNKEQANDILVDSYPMPQWIQGDAVTTLTEQESDFIFTCPPYYNLEKYSDDEYDLSNMSIPEFELAFDEAIYNAVFKLKNDRFAVIVIGDVRTDGVYNNFYSLTVNAFKKSGCDFYNDLVLLQEPATAAMRSFNFMNSSRKIAKCHQNVLVFCKGDPIKATERLPKFDPNTKLIELKRNNNFNDLFNFIS